MTFEERIEKLTERHEALTQFVDLTAHENAAQLQRINETIERRFKDTNETLSRKFKSSFSSVLSAI